jgi:SPP1 family predicted phage head-tail adaptor
MPMRAGKLRHEVVIEEATRAADAYGQQNPTWSTFASTYARIEHLRGNELLVAKQVNGDIDTKITIRWVSGVRTDMRIQGTHDGASRYYNIININTLNEIEETLEIMCKRLEDNTNG